MSSRHTYDELLAYCEGELEEQVALRVREHLEICRHCRQRYEEISRGVLLARHLSSPQRCDLSWNQVEQYLRDARRHSLPSWTFLRLRSAAVIFTVCLVILIGNLFIRHLSSDKKVDLDHYLIDIESSASEQAQRKISDAPPGFNDADQSLALEAAGIAHAATQPPLSSYKLVQHRIDKINGKEVSQLVYHDESNAFAVFVAPRTVPFSFGKRQIQSIDLEGIRCRGVSSPRISAVVFSAARFHCVLVTQSRDRNELAAIIRYFISAHKNGERS